MERLNPHQERFCIFYATHGDCFGNGTEAYLAAYGDSIDRSNPRYLRTAAAAASRLLTQVNISRRISELLEENGFSNANVDKQHMFLINQYVDFHTKMAAIKEYHKLKGKIAENPRTQIGISFSSVFNR